MENTKMQNEEHNQQLPLNICRWLHKQDTVEATKYLDYFRIHYEIKVCSEGFWLNLFLKNSIISRLTYRELELLQTDSSLKQQRKNHSMKTTTDTKLTLTEDMKVDPRKQMLKVRSDVKAYLKDRTKNNGTDHLGKYPTNWDDAVRTIIALQDLYEAKSTAHKKASTHICDLINMLEITNLNFARQVIDLQQYSLKLEVENKHLHGLRPKVTEFETQLADAKKTIKFLTDMMSGE